MSQPVTGEQCQDNSVLRLCTSEEIMCSCLAQGVVLSWLNNLFIESLSFLNTGGGNNAVIGDQDVDSATGATAVVTAVNPRVDIASNLTLSVTTTATVNASQFDNNTIMCEDDSGPSGEMQQTIFLFGRFIHLHCFAIHTYDAYL